MDKGERFEEYIKAHDGTYRNGGNKNEDNDGGWYQGGEFLAIYPQLAKEPITNFQFVTSTPDSEWVAFTLGDTVIDHIRSIVE